MEQQHKDKIKAMLQDVFFNENAQKEWTDTVDRDFLAAMEVFAKRYDKNLSKMQWMRTGVMLGAVYEIWKKRQSEGGS